MSPFDNIKSKLHNFKSTKTNMERSGRASCPCCGKKGTDQKLSVAENDDGNALLYCHAGCGAADVLAALCLDLSDLYQSLQFHGHSEKAQKGVKGVKGWHWGSLAAELEARAESCNRAYFELIKLLPKNDEARLIVAKLAGDQKDFAQRLKFGRGVK